MTISAGTRLGPYEILSQIGAGGMGEVYCARDTKLGRLVAVKVLPAALAQDPERLARFEREARLLASLDHANIGAIYGLEESDGTRALILALIEGPTLADRIATGPVPLEEVIHIAQQMAEALEYAHDRGVIHRDLKPANVKITPEGTVKVLDFGLAKALTGESDASSGSPANSPTMSPTLSMRPTQVGMILGTAAYMAPEQAKGKTADRRADIWAFGVVLFEMLTSEHLFTGDTAAEIIASAIKDEPKLDRLPASTPLVIRRLIERCLNKNPKRRLQAIGEARIALQNAEENPEELALPTPKPRFRWLAWSVAGVLLVITLAVSFLHFREVPPVVPEIAYSIPAPEDSSFANWAELSPDGKYLAYLAAKDGKPALWLRPLNSLEARPIIVEPVNYAFWSTDSRWIAYASGDKLQKVDITAATLAPLVICECIRDFRGGAWGSEGTIVFSPRTATGLFRVSASGGTPTPATTLDARLETLHRFPSFLPDGRRFLYFVGSAERPHAGVYLGDLQSKEPGKRILDSDSHAVFVPRHAGDSHGHLIFVKDNSLRAISFDSEALSLSGDPIVIAQGVGQRNGHGGFSVSGNDILAYWSGDSFGSMNLDWYGRDGNSQGSVLASDPLPSGILTGLSLSEDDKSLAMGIGGIGSGTERTWLIDLVRRARRPLEIGGKGRSVSPVWSMDSRQLAFGYSEPGALNLFVQSASQPEPPKRLLTTAATVWPTGWSHDGNILVYEVDSGGPTGHDLWALSLSDKKPHVWLEGPAMEAQGQLASGSANPWWMAYTSSESGRAEVYLESFTVEGRRAGRVQLSTNGGRNPRWRGDARELYFTSADRKLMSVQIRPNFTADAPRELFTVPRLAPGSIYNSPSYAVTHDGRRFVIVTKPEDQQTAPLSVVVNWRATFKK